VSRFDPATYPGHRPDGPVLVYQGREWPVRVDGATSRPVTAPDAAQGADVLATDDVRWIVAYGANASPDRLIDKVLDLRGALLLPARLYQWRLVWEARHSASTGAVPLTLASSPGSVLDTWVLGVHPVDVDTVDRSEGRGGNYDIGRVGHVAVAGRFLLAEALAYGPTDLTRVLLDDDGDELTWPPLAQADAVARLDATAPVGRGVPLAGAVRSGWPPTPLDDLDLFVYGTLKPGMSRWDGIRDLVDVLGEASTPGWLRATFYGWPAAGLEAGRSDERVHGYVLRPRDAASAHELYRRVDRIEDEPDLFRRVSVRVKREDGATGWVAAYTWAADEIAPGTVVADGRWKGG
jgi:gamma-glutamylcyclotransferase (GGCT)/AIG2-like uncharacterized protein YtfP